MFFISDSKKIYYRTVGIGKPLVIVHGGLGIDHRYLYAWFLPLSKYFKLVFVDLPGNGMSAQIKSNDPFSIERLADTLEVLRKNIIKDKIFLLGHSYGGFVSAVYAIRNPETLRKLVVVGGALDLPSQNNGALEIASNALPSKSRRVLNEPVKCDEDFRRFISHAMPLYFFDMKNVCKFNQKNKSMYRFQAYKRGEGERYKLKHYRELYSKIKAPSLILDGKHDIIEGSLSSLKFRKSVKLCEHYVFKKSGHFPFVEEQALFLKKVREFLK